MKRALLFVCLAVCALAAFGAASAALANPATRSLSASAAGPTPTPTSCVAYTCSTAAGGTIVAGTTDTGNHCDDCTTLITLPFPISLYGVAYTNLNVSSNGNAQFVSTNPEFNNVCLPFAAMGPTIFAYWDDLATTGAVCTGGCGIYTSVSGSTPNRIFNIEWRTGYFSNPGNAYFEVRLNESTANFTVVIGAINTGGTATIGTQDGGGRFTQCQCGTGPSNSTITFTANTAGCPTSTVTPTYTRTPTNVPTNTPVSTATSTLTFTPVNTPTPTGTPLLVGHVTWQGRPIQPNALQQLPITLTLKSGTNEVNFPQQTTDASGFFTVEIGSLPQGVYNWRVKGPNGVIKTLLTDPPGFLSTCGVVTLGTAPQIGMEMGLMMAGDVNNDNVVNIGDFNSLKVSFGKASGDPGYDNRADFTGNGLVNILDFSLLSQSFGINGCSALAAP